MDEAILYHYVKTVRKENNKIEVVNHIEMFSSLISIQKVRRTREVRSNFEAKEKEERSTGKKRKKQKQKRPKRKKTTKEKKTSKANKARERKKKRKASRESKRVDTRENNAPYNQYKRRENRKNLRKTLKIPPKAVLQQKFPPSFGGGWGKPNRYSTRPQRRPSFTAQKRPAAAFSPTRRQKFKPGGIQWGKSHRLHAPANRRPFLRHSDRGKELATRNIRVSSFFFWP